MEVVLNLPPLDIFVKGEARMAAYRLRCTGNWRYHIASEHTRIDDILQSDILTMMSDRMSKKVDIVKPYQVNLVDRGEWEHGEPEYMKRGFTLYTDGSKRSSGTGAGIFGVRPRVRFSISLGKTATVFQAEVIALAECAKTCIGRGLIDHTIYMCSDSKAALMALAGYTFTSKVVWDCHLAMKALGRTNRVVLMWVPGHKGIEGNEGADQWANIGAASPLVGPEPSCGVSSGLIRSAVRQWVAEEHRKHWKRTDGNIQAKRMMLEPDRRQTSDALSLGRQNLRKVVGFLTGHWVFRGHLIKMGIRVQSILCRKCGEEAETASHVIFKCPALITERTRTLGALWSGDQGDEQESIVKRLSSFIKDLGFDGE